MFDPECEIANRWHSTFEPDGSCRGCRKAVGKGRRVWCSAKCNTKWWNDFARDHDWTTARRAVKRRDKKQCRRCGAAERLEVNHIVPLVGAGYGLSCAHHRANLELLCRACHYDVTAKQRALRKRVASKRGASAT